MTKPAGKSGGRCKPRPPGPRGETLPSFQRSLPVLLFRAREAVMGYLRPVLRANGLTEQQWRVLRALDDEGAMEASELARFASILPPSLSRILKLLEAKGWVTRRTDRSDLRRAVIAISPKGRAVIRRIVPQAEAQYALIIKAFGAREVDALVRELIRLTALKP